MPEFSSMHATIQRRLAMAFGTPHQSFGKDSLWGLRSASRIPAVNVLVNGSEDIPVIWVFDPHDHQDGVSHYSIRSEADLDPIIAKIEHRVRQPAG
jgi:hypothetical protein